MSRRDQIRMSDEEVAALLDEERTLVCATMGRDGWPHLMPLWYVVRDGTVWAWTYAASQKVRNLERDPRATIEVEAGAEYQELRGVMLKTQVTVYRDTERVAGLGADILTRYGPDGEPTEEMRGIVARQAAKRVGLEFRETQRATWDHRKLGAGTY
ncbi:MAG: pyridoxamine 5'-phosphate oxidase family protein [Actinomycetota bacterium]|nr:pyridoxamine 5'-phosphate oxidase family protein [Actinomycetota bacterium]